MLFSSPTVRVKEVSTYHTIAGAPAIVSQRIFRYQPVLRRPQSTLPVENAFVFRFDAPSEVGNSNPSPVLLLLVIFHHRPKNHHREDTSVVEHHHHAFLERQFVSIGLPNPVVSKIGGNRELLGCSAPRSHPGSYNYGRMMMMMMILERALS